MVTKKDAIKSKLKNYSSIGLLLIGFIIGLIVMYLYIQPKLAYQERTAREWTSKANKSQQQADFYKKNWFSAMSKLDPNPFLTTPTPTPILTPNASCQSVVSTNGHYLGQICGGVLIGPNGQ